MASEEKFELHKKLLEFETEIKYNTYFLLQNYKEINTLLDKIEKEKVTMFFYFNKTTIHKILEAEDKIINIEANMINQQSLKSLFYLALAIKNEKFVINYAYNKIFINDLYMIAKSEKSSLKQLLFYIFFDIILENYKQLDKTEDSISGEELDKMTKEIENSINEKYYILENYNITLPPKKEYDFENIYSKIIIYLIMNKKFEEYEYAKNIMEQLDLENIEFTYKIYNELEKFFEDNYNEDFLDDYKIKDMEKLFNEKIINFFFILLKYVFKHNIYQYNIRFLYDTKKSILDILRKNPIKTIQILSYNELEEKESIKSKSKFILNYFIDSDYYITKEIFSTLKEVLDYFEKFLFETKKKEIKDIKEILSKKDYNNCDKYNSFYEEAKRRNKRYNIIKYFLENKDEILVEKNFLKKYVTSWENIENHIHEKRLKKLGKKYIFKIYNYFTEEKNKEDILGIFKQDEVDYFIKYHNLLIVKTYYQKFFFESKKEDIENLENTDKIDIDKYLKDFDLAQKMLETYDLTCKLFKIDGNVKTEKEAQEKISKWKDIKNKLETKDFDFGDDNLKLKLMQYFIGNKNNKLINEEGYQFLLKQIDEAEKLITNYYLLFFPETYKTKIELIRKKIKEDKLVDYIQAKNNMLRKPIIFSFLEEGNEKNEDEIKKATSYWDQIEHDIRSKNYRYIQEKDIKKIITFFEDYENQFIQIFGEETINDFLKYIEGDKKQESNYIDNSSTTYIDSKASYNHKIIKKNMSGRQKKVNKDELNKSLDFPQKKEKEKREDEFYEKSLAKKELIKTIILKYHLGILFFVENKNILIKSISISEKEHSSPLFISENDFNDCKEYYSRKKNSKEYKVFKYLEDFKENFLYLYNKDSKVVLFLLFEKTDLDYSCKVCLFPQDLKGYNISFIAHEITYNSDQTYLSLLLEEIEKNQQTEKKPKKNKQNRNRQLNPPNDNRSMNTTKLESTMTAIESDPDKTATKYQVLKFIKVMGNHNEAGRMFTAEFIKELKECSRFISGGTDKRLKFYDYKFNEEKPGPDFGEIKDWTYSVYEKPGRAFFVCGNKELYAFQFDKNNNLVYNSYEMNNITCISSLEMEVKEKEIIKKNPNNKNKKNNQKSDNKEIEEIKEKIINYFIIAGRNGFIGIDNSNFDKNDNNQTKNQPIKTNLSDLNDKIFKNIIKLDDKNIALTSNTVFPGGEDKLIIYNVVEKKVKEMIEGYSFNISTNGLAIMFEENLLCACKKYSDYQKNGILLVQLNFEEKSNSTSKFYDTDEFEVYCFCPIKNFGESVIIDINKGNNYSHFKETDFFFVGGFDKKRREGRIKLFKLERNEVNQVKDIKYLQEIELDKTNENEYDNKEKLDTYFIFKGFKGAISSMIQSENNNTNNILVSCYDGKVYLLSKPNLAVYNEKYSNNKNS